MTLHCLAAKAERGLTSTDNAAFSFTFFCFTSVCSLWCLKQVLHKHVMNTKRHELDRIGVIERHDGTLYC